MSAPEQDAAEHDAGEQDAERAGSAERYAEYWERLNASHAYHPANRYRYWLIVRQLARARLRFLSVLDCGCGDGSLLALMRERFALDRALGLDISPANVELLRARVQGSEFHCLDLGLPIEEVPFEPVDLALCSEVIEHVADDDALLANLARLVAPGGHVVLTTQSGPIRRTERYLGHLRHYAAGELRSRLEAVGFEAIQCTQSGWPLLDAQKILAERFFEQVENHVISPARPALPIRVAFSALFHAYKACALGRGPQLFFLARLASG